MSKTQSVTRKIVFCAVATALACVTSMIKIVDMPMGGSVTLCSMMFICLIGYWFGLKYGLMTGLVYGLIQLVTNGYVISIPQMIVDYFLSFGVLGISGLFYHNRKYGLILGYLAGVFGRFVFAFLSGMIFFGQYAKDYNMAAPIYSFLYNGAYLGLEALITVVVLLLPPVKKGIDYVRNRIIEEH